MREQVEPAHLLGKPGEPIVDVDRRLAGLDTEPDSPGALRPQVLVAVHVDTRLNRLDHRTKRAGIVVVIAAVGNVGAVTVAVRVRMAGVVCREDPR